MTQCWRDTDLSPIQRWLDDCLPMVTSGVTRRNKAPFRGPATARSNAMTATFQGVPSISGQTVQVRRVRWWLARAGPAVGILRRHSITLSTAIADYRNR